tara:strand:+ start:668 stop:1117 length:450 start_codon:yes stop_codon:yes gene_type:complete
LKLSQIIKIANIEAHKAFKRKEVPVGAVIFDKNQIISKSHNLCNTKKDPLLHAEIIALREASRKIKNSSLKNLNLYVTLEPCLFCSYAISKYRIKTLYFGAYDTKNGSLENGIRLFNTNLNIYRPEVYGGIGAEYSEILIKKFFKKLRS